MLCYKQILIEKTKLKTLCLNSEQAAIKIKKCCNNIVKYVLWEINGKDCGCNIFFSCIWNESLTKAAFIS